MKISQSGLDLIKRFEGLRLDAYQCSAGVWTIGYGTTNTALGPVKEGMRITESEAETLLASDVRYFEQRVNDLVKVPLTQSQFDALVSLAYNIGDGALASSTLLRELNAGNYQEAGEQFLRWNKANGETLPGLVSRRTTERNLFLSQGAAAAQPAGATPSPAPPAPSTGGIMSPLLIPAITALVEAVPSLLRIFKGDSRTVERNAKAIEVISSVVKDVTGEASVSAAAEMVLSDPAVKATFEQAIQNRYYDLVEVGGGIQEARAFAMKATQGNDWRAIGFGALMAVLSLIILLGGGFIFYQLLFHDSTNAEQRGMLVGALVAFLSAVIGYWFGSSVGSKQSGDAVRRIAEK